MKKKELPKLPYGEGSFSYVNSGAKFRILYQKMIGKINKKRQKVYGDTIKECMEKMKELEYEYIKLESETTEYSPEVSEALLLRDSMKVWLYEFKRTELKKDKSFDTIESTFNTHIKNSLIGKMPLINISSLVIKNYLNNLANDKSVSTLKKVYSLFNQFFAHYYASNPLKNPMMAVKMPVVKKKVDAKKIKSLDDFDDLFEENIVSLNDDEINLLIDELTKPIIVGVGGYKHGYAILFLMWSFMRVGEALALRWKDVDFEERSVKIYKAYTKVRKRDENGQPTGSYEWLITPPKSKSSIRKLYIDKKAVDCLLKYKEIIKPESDENFIIRSSNDNPVSLQYLNAVLKSALDHCGIKTEISIHGLRHTGISYYIRHGVPIEIVSKMAGHSDISTTTRIYYDVIEEQKKNAFKNLDNKDEQ